MRWSAIAALLLFGLLPGCTGEVLPPFDGQIGSSGSSLPARTATASTSRGSASAASSTGGSNTGSTGTSDFGSSGSTGSSSGSNGSTSGSTGAGCDAGCSSNARCESGLCVCEPGYSAGASGCEPVSAGDPTTHSQAQVCQAWSDGHVENANPAFTPGATACDPGSLSTAALDDALRRLDMFRWMIGLGPVTDDASDDANDQACAVIAANNPAGPQAHYPDSSFTCYSSAGAAGAGSSNIAWGCSSAADAMDQWVVDWDNATTLGHRRWLFNPPLENVGIGFVSGGSGQWGSASCLGVFGGGNPNPDPLWTAYPPPGFVPASAIYPIWSLHSDRIGVSSARTCRSPCSN
jgi:hypothetical protein